MLINTVHVLSRTLRRRALKWLANLPHQLSISHGYIKVIRAASLSIKFTAMRLTFSRPMPSSYAVIPRHRPTPSSHAVVPCCRPLLSSLAVVPLHLANQHPLTVIQACFKQIMQLIKHWIKLPERPRLATEDLERVFSNYFAVDL